jgi:hypothetical protein
VEATRNVSTFVEDLLEKPSAEQLNLTHANEAGLR